MSNSELESLLLMQIKALKLPTPEREFKFHKTRKWRLDFYWPEYKFACEVEGGVYIKGGHTRGAGFEKDCTKYGEAMLAGITVYRCTGNLIKRGEAVAVIEKMLELITQDNELDVGEK